MDADNIMRIRRFRIGDEPALFEVFHSAIHLIAARDYTPAQIDAWAPANLDQDLWRERMRGIRHGFTLIEQRYPVQRGVVVPNALMRKRLAGG